MESKVPRTADGRVLQLSVEAAIRIGVLALIVIWALSILQPFVQIVLWAIILAVAVHPLHTRLARHLGGHDKLCAILITTLALVMLLVPTWIFYGATIDEVRGVAAQAQAGTLELPPPSDGVRNWPLIGEKVYSAWDGASKDLEATMERLAPELASLGKWGLGSLASLAETVLQFLVSILIAGVLLNTGKQGESFSVQFATRLAGAPGKEFVKLAVATIRSVAQGVLGVAVIQAALAAVGMLLLGVPGAMLWALLVMIFSIVQLPPVVVIGPVIVWGFATQSTPAAVIFLVYGGFVSVCDTLLKPLFLGRGMNIPMLVILLGAIGGMLTAGIIGLFVGAVVLALAYQLMMAWLEQDADRGVSSEVAAPVAEEGDS